MNNHHAAFHQQHAARHYRRAVIARAWLEYYRVRDSSYDDWLRLWRIEMDAMRYHSSMARRLMGIDS